MTALRLLALALSLALMDSSAFADKNKNESGKGKSYFHRHGYTRLNIPEGHYPPPGECRIWYPDRPPGHQPPPFRCGEAVPSGAWLIQHPVDSPSHVHVTVYDAQRPRVVVAAGEFEIGSGNLIRVLVEK